MSKEYQPDEVLVRDVVLDEPYFLTDEEAEERLVRKEVVIVQKDEKKDPRDEH